jgi:hypothetical protein
MEILKRLMRGLCLNDKAIAVTKFVQNNYRRRKYKKGK